MAILKPNIPLKYVKPDGTTQSEYPLTSIDQVIDEDGIHRLNQTIVRADLSDVEEGQVVLTNADNLNNKDGDYYDYRNSTLTLEEIQASTDLVGKIAGANALKLLTTYLNYNVSYSSNLNSAADGLNLYRTDLRSNNTPVSAEFCLVMSFIAVNSNTYGIQIAFVKSSNTAYIRMK